MSKIRLFSLIIITLSLVIISSIYIKNFRIDASSDTLVAKNDKDYLYFNNYSKLFKSENFLVLAVKNNNLFENSLIKKFDYLSQEILKINNVERVFSFIDAPILFLNNTSLNKLSENNIENIKNSEYNIYEVIEELSKNPIYQNQIINADADVFSLIIYLKKNLAMEEAKINFDNDKISRNQYLKIKKEHDINRKILISNIREVINKIDDNNEYYLGGIEMIASDVIDFVKKDILIFSIFVTFIIILVLFLIFRQIKFVFICLASSVYSVFVIFGLISFLQIEVTAVSSNFAALIFILSISMNIHIINYYRQLDKKLEFKIQTTFSKMFWPCLYTTLTTMVAFGSLVITEIKPIIDFGIIMIISLIISFACSFLILPLLLIIAPSIIRYNQNIFNYKNIFLSISNNFYKIIIFITLTFFILSIGGILKLNVENSFVNYFNKNTEIYKGMKLIDDELGGTTPLDIIINFEDFDELVEFDNKKIKEYNSVDDDEIFDDEIFDGEIFDDEIFKNNTNNSWFTQEKLEIISNIHNYLEKREEIGKVQSVNSLIELANLINKKPLEIFELSVLYEEIPENYKENLIYPYLLVDENMAKITARVKDSQKINRKNLINEIKLYLENIDNSSVKSFKVNGLLVLYNNMLESLFDSQIKSLGFVIVLIFIMFIILFRSIKLSIIGIIPNIFASSFILGIIGYLSIPLDIMTITIAAITIGIAVDNTIHYLYRFKEYNKNNNLMDSIKLTNSSAGLAVLTTSITIALGFSVLCFSSFIPTILFGIFTALAMIFAMLGVLILIPSLLMYSKYKNG